MATSRPLWLQKLEAAAGGSLAQPISAVASNDIQNAQLTDVMPLSLGIETLGGVFTPIIDRGTPIPTERTQVFSTADDYQTSLTIRIFQGVRKMVANNRLLAHLDVVGIHPAARGVVQIEITFAVDENGIVSFSAKDRMTGNRSEIRVQWSGGGLSDPDIERMISDAKLANEIQD